MRAGAVLVAVVLAAACGGQHRSHAPPLLADRHAPLQVADRSVATRDPRVRLRDVSFAGRRGRVEGYLALPAKPRGRLAAVVLFPGAGGTRAEFLPYALTLAARGFAALTITSPSSSAPAPLGRLGPRAILRREQQLSADDVVAARRSVDFLETLASVDRRRIGFVGWSAGARTGAVVAGVERRIRAFVLMSAGAIPVREYVQAAPARLRSDVRGALVPVDPLRWIARARPGTLFLEDGLRDEIVPRRALLALAHAAPPRTRLRWYDAGHRLDRAAVRDQISWLTARLTEG